jgi:hypothetical protein
MPHERRLGAYAAGGLFLTLFLPWYQETVVVAGASKKLQTLNQSFTAWSSFSFVEAAILLVAAGVLTLLFQRAEGRAFHLPGGDGGVITAAGLWTSILVIWRIFDKQGTSNQGQVASSSGIEWGIFVTLAVAAFLTYAGTRIRAAHQPEPPLPGEDRPARGRGQQAPVGPSPAQGRPNAERSSPEPPAPERRAPDRPAPERRAPGWLTAPPEHRRRPSPAAPKPETASPEPPAPQPRPVPADDPPTVPADDPPTVRAEDPPLPPSTPAARRQKQSDEQLTIPLEHDE